MSYRLVTTPDGAALFDDARAAGAQPDWLDAEWWRARGPVRTPSGGRGAALLVDGAFGAGVLRHYRRGGFVARFSEDLYVFTGGENTRSFREFRLLGAMLREELPVPAPLGARYTRTGPFYRADILVAAIPATRTLAQSVEANAVVPWRAIGACIARFHDAGIRHADLNAHNVLIDTDERVWLIDFDRAERRARGAWRRENVERLARSLRKIGAPARVADFDAGWHELARAAGAR